MLPGLEKDRNGELNIQTSSAEEGLISKIEEAKDTKTAEQLLDALKKSNELQEKYIASELKVGTDQINIDTKNKIIVEENTNKKEISETKIGHNEELKDLQAELEKQKAEIEREAKEEALRVEQEYKAEEKSILEEFDQIVQEEKADATQNFNEQLAEIQDLQGEQISDKLNEAQEAVDTINEVKEDKIEAATESKYEKLDDLIAKNEAEEEITKDSIIKIEENIEGSSQMIKEEPQVEAKVEVPTEVISEAQLEAQMETLNEQAEKQEEENQIKLEELQNSLDELAQVETTPAKDEEPETAQIDLSLVQPTPCDSKLSGLQDQLDKLEEQLAKVDMQSYPLPAQEVVTIQ